MNVTDRWMLEKMQQMAASMASSLPQAGQNADQPPKTEKGESFQDLLNKAKDQQVEAAGKDNSPEKKEPVQSKEPAQKPQKPQQTQKEAPVQTEAKQVAVTAEEAAMLTAGYAKLSPPTEDGEVWMVTVRDEDGNLVLPLNELEGAAPYGQGVPDGLLTEGQWTVEPTEELTAALEQLIQETGDPRSAEDILGALEQKLQNVADGQPKMELAIGEKSDFQAKMLDGLKTVEVEEDGGDDAANLDAEMLAPREPLFKDVKAAPIKVGENFQLDTQEPEMDAKLADAIRFAAQQGLKQIEIKLCPENLGNLTVKLTQAADGTLQVVLHAANAKAASLLTQHMDGLNAALQGYSQNNEVHVEVQRNGENQQAQQQQQQQTDPDGRNQQQQQQQQQRQQDNGRSGDFLQKLRLGLFSLDDVI